MKQYNRIMLGKGGLYADKCLEENFIGADFDIREDLTYKLKDNWRIFNDEYVPIYMAANPDTKFGASPPRLTAKNPVVFSEHHHPKMLKTL